jgi:hypothetical protein
VNVLREDLSSAAAALAEILESLQDPDGEHGDRLREALRALRGPPGEDADSIRYNALGAAKTIENRLAAVRERHQLSVSQLRIEIRMLRKRIDALESASICGPTYSSLPAPGYGRASPAAEGFTPITADARRRHPAGILRIWTRCGGGIDRRGDPPFPQYLARPRRGRALAPGGLLRRN